MTDTTHYQNFYGRFKGRPLGSVKAKLMDDLLGKLHVHLEPGQYYHPRHFFNDSGQNFTKFILEIGFGGGEHIAAMALKNPESGFIGCEVFVNGVASLLKYVANQQLANIRIHNTIIQSLIPVLAEQSFHEIYIMFPDPWPKFRHKKRQLINSNFLNSLSKLLADNGFIHMASDDQNYVQSILQSLADVKSLTLVSQTNMPLFSRNFTKYEQKAIDEQRICHYLTAVKRTDNTTDNLKI